MIHCLMFWGLCLGEIALGIEFLILGFCTIITNILTIVATLAMSTVLPLYITMPPPV